MREIKFRAWEKKLKHMITVTDIDFESKMINKSSVWRFFDELVLMQYTGLKDKNGVEIYEGDVVKGHWWDKGEKHRHIGRVALVMNAYKVRGVKQYFGIDDDLNPTYEIIGNIHDNPELLEVSE